MSKLAALAADLVRAWNWSAGVQEKNLCPFWSWILNRPNQHLISQAPKRPDVASSSRSSDPSKLEKIDSAFIFRSFWRLARRTWAAQKCLGHLSSSSCSLPLNAISNFFVLRFVEVCRCFDWIWFESVVNKLVNVKCIFIWSILPFESLIIFILILLSCDGPSTKFQFYRTKFQSWVNLKNSNRQNININSIQFFKNSNILRFS